MSFLLKRQRIVTSHDHKLKLMEQERITCRRGTQALKAEGTKAYPDIAASRYYRAMGDAAGLAATKSMISL
jgi:hypothetical protein